MTEPILTEGDRHTAVWQKIKAYLEAQRDILRARNDKPLTPSQTDTLRGQIQAVNSLLSLGAPKQILVSEDDKFKD